MKTDKFSLLLLFFPFLILFSCTDKNKLVSHSLQIIDEKETVVTIGQLSYKEDMKQFYDLCIGDSLLFLISQRNESPITVLTLNDFNNVLEIGDYGQGPEGVDFIHFLKKIKPVNSIELLDINRKSFVNVCYNKDIGRYTIEKEKMPDSIWPSLNLNKISDYRYFATGLSPFNKGLYFKWDKLSNTKEWIEYYPKTKKKYAEDVSFIYRNSIIVNQNFVVSVLYYFNKILIYDLKGNIIKEIQIGKESFEPVMENFEQYRLSNETESFFLSVKASEEYFYCLWNRSDGGVNSEKRMNSKIFVFDWEFNHISTFKTDRILEEFDVDPYNKYILGIISDEEEDSSIYKFEINL